MSVTVTVEIDGHRYIGTGARPWNAAVDALYPDPDGESIYGEPHSVEIGWDNEHEDKWTATAGPITLARYAPTDPRREVVAAGRWIRQVPVAG